MTKMTPLKIEVMRYNPECDTKPYFETLTLSVPYDEHSLLDALGYIKDNLAPYPLLSYRWSCRMGQSAVHAA